MCPVNTTSEGVTSVTSLRQSFTSCLEQRTQKQQGENYTEKKNNNKGAFYNQNLF
jgi:hypothetical protein